MLFSMPSSSEDKAVRQSMTTTLPAPAARQAVRPTHQHQLFPTPDHLLPTHQAVERTRMSRVTELSQQTRNLVFQETKVQPNEVNAMVWLTPKNSAITSSRSVAACFNKEHKHVLRDIRTLQATLAEVEDEGMYFAEHGYRDTQGQLRPEIVMTQRGFMLLTMGFTGAEALRYKLAFLDAFELTMAKATQTGEFMPEPVNSPTRIAQLAYYTREEMQVECVKQVASHVMLNSGGGKGALVHHHRSVMKLLTGLKPSEYRKQLQEGDEKLRIKSKSGRQLLREYEPAKAAAAAVLDDAVRNGVSLQQLLESDAAYTLSAAFDSMLALGLRPADLE